MEGSIPRRRHMPHPEDVGGVVCITWRLHRSQEGLTDHERDLVLKVLTISDGDQCEIVAAVVMDDHVHVLTRPLGGETGRSLTQRWKSISSRWMTREGDRRAPIWQAEYFDRWMKSETQLKRCAGYVLQNPTRRWPHLVGYRWLIDRSADR